MTNLDITTDRLCLKILNENYADIVASFLKKKQGIFWAIWSSKTSYILYTLVSKKHCRSRI